MPDREWLLLPDILTGSLYIRDLYKPLLELLLALPTKSSAVVTGVAGTGKSAFALLLLRHLAKERRRVIWTGYRSGSSFTMLLDFTSPDITVKYSDEPVGGELLALGGGHTCGAVSAKRVSVVALSTGRARNCYWAQ